MKKISKEVSNIKFFDLTTKQSLLNLYKILNTNYICGELHKNLILNPNKNSTFLYYELRKDEVILGFKHTNDKLYQQLLKAKDAYIFSGINTESSTELPTEQTDQTEDKKYNNDETMLKKNMINEQKEEDISNLIKDIKNYSYIQGGALVTFHKRLLLDYLANKLEDIKKKEITGK